MLSLAVLVAATLADDGISTFEIRSETSCPSAAAVRAQVEPLAPRPWPPEVTGTSVVLTEQSKDSGLTVTLQGPDGAALEQRRLPPYGACDDRARAVAVVIASWLTTLPASAPAVVRLPADSTVILARAAAAPVRPLAFTASAAALATLAFGGGGPTPGALLEATVRRRGTRWSLSIDGLLDGTHRLSIGTGTGTGAGAGGQATWWRWAVAPGLAGEIARRGRLWWGAQAIFVVSRLRIAGAGFSDNAGGATWDLGGALGTRLGLTLRGGQPWLGAFAVRWGGTQAVHVDGDSARAEIPRWQVGLAVGATFGNGGETF